MSVPRLLMNVCFLLLLCAETGAQSSPFRYNISISDQGISILKNEIPILQIDSIRFNFVTASSPEIVFMQEDSMVVRLGFKGVPEFNMINKEYDRTIDLVITRKNNSFHFYTSAEWADNFTLFLKDLDDHYFGLVEGLSPDNHKSPDLRGKTVDVEVHGQMYRIQENFTSVWSSFYYNPKGFASFVNTFAKGRYQLGINGASSIHHETGKLDWYVFTGDASQIYEQYYQVIGKPKFVPVWACGPMVWRDENQGGKEQILNDAKLFADHQIPLTALMVDRPYSDGHQKWSAMNFSKTFDHPQVWIRQLDSVYGLKFLTWIAPATFSDTAFPGLLPGSFGYLDLSNPAAVAAFKNRLSSLQYAVGVRGHKMDRADEQFPVEENWHDRTPEAQRKNKYVWLYAKITDSILNASLGHDHFNYARAAVQGCQQYLTGIWGGDPRSSWDGMAANMANAVRASFMGFPNWGTDVGGYLGPTGKIPDDLYIRWLQWGAFNGIFEIKIDGAGGGGEDRAPWNCSDTVLAVFRKTCEQRMEWMPHIFSQLNTSYKTGPLMKPLAMVYPGDTAVHAVWDEYLFGNSLLVAPVFSAIAERQVYLPEGNWLDYYTQEKFEGKQVITAKAGLDKIPVYIRENSLYVKGNIAEGSSRYWKKEKPEFFTDVYYYPGKGEAIFYFVDALKNNTEIKYTAFASENKWTVDLPAVSYKGHLKIFCPSKPKQVKVNNKRSRFVHINNYLIIPKKINKAYHVEVLLQ